MTAIEKEAADHPVESAARFGGEPQLLDKGLLVAIRIEAKGDRLVEGSGEVDEELLIEPRIRRGARELRALEVVVERDVVVGELADEEVRPVRDALVATERGTRQRGIFRVAVLV